MLEKEVKEENYVAMKELMESLTKAVMDVGEQVYKNVNNSNSTKDDSIETDFFTEK